MQILWRRKPTTESHRETINVVLYRMYISCQYREAMPSVLIIDSQSVKVDSWSEGTGYDAGKKIGGVKRRVLVDVFVFLIGVMVRSASISDRDKV